MDRVWKMADLDRRLTDEAREKRVRAWLCGPWHCLLRSLMCLTASQRLVTESREKHEIALKRRRELEEKRAKEAEQRKAEAATAASAAAESKRAAEEDEARKALEAAEAALTEEDADTVSLLVAETGVTVVQARRVLAQAGGDLIQAMWKCEELVGKGADDADTQAGQCKEL